MRLLQAARLSRLNDDSTRIATQDESVRGYAESNGHTIIATAADTDISGDTDPWRRPELGPWLSKPELIAQYDGIAASHIDRLARSTIFFMQLLHWAEEHGKVIITTGTDGIDFSSPVGRLLGYIISWLGEQELESIKRRARGSRKWLIDNGYLSGRAPWGYRIVPRGDHKTLEPDPDLAPVVREMVERYLQGETLTALCEWLNDRGIATPFGNKWTSTPLRGVLRSHSLTGRRKNAAGHTELRFPGIISQSQWLTLQKALDARALNRNLAPGDTAVLTNVAVCIKCEGWMYLLKQRRPNKTYRYYRCHGVDGPSTCRNLVPAEELEQWVDDYFTSPPWAGHEVIERLTIPGNGHQDEIDALTVDLADLAGLVGELPRNDYLARQSAILAELDRVQGLPPEPDQVVERPTGVTLGELWQTFGPADKRKYLMAAGIRVHAIKGHYEISGDPWKLVSDATGAPLAGRSLIGLDLETWHIDPE